MNEPDPHQPLDYEKGATSPFDRPIQPWQRRRRWWPRTGRGLRIAYWLVCLAAIALLLWYLRGMMQYESLMK